MLGDPRTSALGRLGFSVSQHHRPLNSRACASSLIYAPQYGKIRNQGRPSIKGHDFLPCDSFFFKIQIQFLLEIPRNTFDIFSTSFVFGRVHSLDMWSSAIFLAACLSIAFANPVALLNVRTTQDPSEFFVTSDGDISMTGFSTPGQSNSIPAGPAVPVLTAAVGNNDWGKVSSSDFDGIYAVPDASLGSNFNNEYTPQLPNNFFAHQYQENPSIPNEQSVTLGPYLNPGDSAQFSDNLLAQSTQCPGLLFTPVRPTVDWSVSWEFQVDGSGTHLNYPKTGDCGSKTFMCKEDDLGCCGDSYGELEGKLAASPAVFIKVKCKKCLFLTNQSLIGC